VVQKVPYRLWWGGKYLKLAVERFCRGWSEASSYF
jgi:hypothetical protein